MLKAYFPTKNVKVRNYREAKDYTKIFFLIIEIQYYCFI